MIGCKKVIYNDYLEEWKNNALLIAKAIDIDVDEYIVGDVDATVLALKEKNIECDLITSRNVIEHIYKLDYFYKVVHEHQPKAIIYSSTTANFINPAMNLQHVLLHRKIEKTYSKFRSKIIEDFTAAFSKEEVATLAKQTRGYNITDLHNAIAAYVSSGKKPVKGAFYTNTCHPNSGVWAENILPMHIHRRMIQASGMKAVFQPGFWDTHYRFSPKNFMGKIFNGIIMKTNTIGYLLTPFIYVIALPKKTVG
jgi:hypothetical protein